MRDKLIYFFFSFLLVFLLGCKNEEKVNLGLEDAERTERRETLKTERKKADLPKRLVTDSGEAATLMIDLVETYTALTDTQKVKIREIAKSVGFEQVKDKKSQRLARKKFRARVTEILSEEQLEALPI